MTSSQIDIDFIISLVRKAGEEILKIYHQNFDVDYKSDNSPITLADKNAHAILVKALKGKYPCIPILSEEGEIAPYSERKHWQSFWLIDPLDGTKEFLKKNDEFTVNIAFIENGFPTFGVVYAPALNVLYYGLKETGSFKIDSTNRCLSIKSSSNYLDKKAVKIVGSRSHSDKQMTIFIEQLEKQGKQVELATSGSSLKLCFVAEGSADIYPRFTPTMEWDTAAANAVVVFAGKQVLQMNTQNSLVYNKENLLNPSFIVY
jgi:3'(2'), 5'-bisphosphate nucleotidase